MIHDIQDLLDDIKTETTDLGDNNNNKRKMSTTEEKAATKIINVNVTSYKLYWREKFSEEFGTKNVSEIKGDSLAWLKVSTYINY